ncbi:MAG: Phosphorylated carbohydrates phosphatase [Chlamydiae bacterium]|nr:Phosphorylated carbohydrates phosphatase [Chlamydiota bacterium]
MQLQALFFDLDGTIANSMPYLYQSYQKVLKPYEISVEKKDFFHLLTLSFEDMLAYFSKKHVNIDPKKIVLDYFDEVHLGYLDAVDVYEGAKEFIEKATKNHKLFLVTNADDQLASSFLKKHGMLEAFDGVITSSEPRFAKPHPYLYHKALQQSKCNSDEVCAIEDSKAGILAAHLANIPLIFIDHHQMDIEKKIKQIFFQNFKNWQEALQWLHLQTKKLR